MLKKQWMVAFLCAGCVLAGSARAAQGDWLGRVRAIHISPDASSSALNLDFSYFVTNNLALELILATKGHNVTAGARLWAASSCCRRH